jgi:hypothetical protein
VSYRAKVKNDDKAREAYDSIEDSAGDISQGDPPPWWITYKLGRVRAQGALIGHMFRQTTLIALRQQPYDEDDYNVKSNLINNNQKHFLLLERPFSRRHDNGRPATALQ